MSNVIELDVVTRLDIPCERALRRAAEADLQSVIVIGRDKDGELFFSSSMADGGDVLWLMEIAKKELIS